jgi:hypothetical protein
MKRPRILFFLVTAILLIILSSYLSFRDLLLNKVVHTRIENYNAQHGAHVHFEKVYFRGLKIIQFDSLSVVVEPGDTLFSIHSFSTGLKIGPLAAGHIRFRSLTLKNTTINFNQDKIQLYFRALSKTDRHQSAGSSAPDLQHKTEQFLKRIFTSLPSKLELTNFCFNYTLDSVTISASINHTLSRKGKFNSIVGFTRGGITQSVEIDGSIKSVNRSVELRINPIQDESLVHSPIAGLLGAKMDYESLSLKFIEKERRGKVLRFEGNYALGRFEIEQESISAHRIEFPGFVMNFSLAVGSDYIELDSISQLRIGKLAMHPFFKYSMSPSDTIAFNIYLPDFTVNDFFSSLPINLFSHLKYFHADGSLSYRAKLLADLKQPDSLILESKLDDENLTITRIDDELKKMNGSFTYTAFEKGIPVRIIDVNPDSPGFVTIDEIPVLLQNAVLLAEDGSYYTHQGFLLSAIRRAIAENIKEKKLYRGGSTISQQLIKNIYLSHEKTISRKLEEVILVWLVESKHLVSKKRMFEVYLNIIEWGPRVYGVKEAAQFYFQKDVRQLKPEECIFLASVIPSPKKFYYRFDKTGHLAPFMITYYNDLSEKLQHKGLLATTNGDSLASELSISGMAKAYLRTDSTFADSLQVKDQSHMEYY